MKKNKYLIITIMLVALFSFKTEVNAAKELTCTYANDYRLTQDANGNLKVYHEDPNVEGKWDEFKMVWDSNGKKMPIELKFETDYYDESTGTLSDCPKYTRRDNEKVFYSDKDHFGLLVWDYELISDEAPENKFQELTCLYEKKGAKNTRDVKKILLTQDSAGVITIYKNEKDVGLSEYSEYWVADAGKKYVFDDQSLKKDANGKLTECPKSKTTLEWPNTGGVEFFGDTSGEDMLEEGYNELVDFLTYNQENDIYENSGLGQTCDSIMIEDKWLTELDESKYVGSSLYQSETDYGCHIIQLDMSTANINVIDSFSSQQITKNGITASYSSVIDQNGFTPDEIEQFYEMGYYPFIYAKIDFLNHGQGVKYYSGRISSNQNGGKQYTPIAVRGKNMFTGEDLSLDTKVNLGFEKVEIVSCEQIFNNNEELINMVKWAITLVKILIPITLVGFGIVDFAQATFSGKEDDMKKVQTRFIKRVIIAVAIFIIPSMLKLVLSIAHNIWPIIDADLCGII